MATMTIWTTVAGMKENISNRQGGPRAGVRTSDEMIPNRDQPGQRHSSRWIPNLLLSWKPVALSEIFDSDGRFPQR